MTTATALAERPQSPSLLAKMAGRFGVEPNKMLATLKATAFKGEVTNEQMMALLIVADQYGLNPWTKEIYAFPDKNNGIIPVVGVDGWSRIINSHEQFDGMEFAEGPIAENGGLPEWVECAIYRKDRAHPVKLREYMVECKRATGPWGSHPRRMLRHKAMIQCARLAFGYAGIYDQDEAERIIERDITPEAEVVTPPPASRTDALKERLRRAESQPEAKPPAPETATFAQVADAITKAERARDPEALEAAGALIHAVVDDTQRAELEQMLNAAKVAL